MAIDKIDTTLIEVGRFKQIIHSSLFKNQDILHVLFDGNVPGKNKDIIKFFKEHVKSHIYIDETIDKKETFIFYDVFMYNGSTTIKNLEIVVYVMTHKDMIDNYSIREGTEYVGNRVDVLKQIINDVLVNDNDVTNQFGIGRLKLDSIEPFNITRFYGSMLKFTVPNFR